MGDFKKLDVWQKAHALERRIDDVLPQIRRKNPDLADQLGRAVASTSACIAEGRGRPTDKDFARFVSMGIASITEAEHHILRAFNCGGIDEADFTALTMAAIQIRKMSIGLRRRLLGNPKPGPQP